MKFPPRSPIILGFLGFVVGAATGCTAPERATSGDVAEGTATATGRQALVSTNGIWTNGLSTNGIWTNGIWTNGIWTNGIWTNGIWTNGIWTNGVSSNGIWTNGIWTNGIWTNGIWTNGIWTNGVSSNGIWTNGIWTNGIWTNGLAGDTLRSNRYTRQLLQYVYACAMPAAVSPSNGGTPTSYDTTLDPNQGTLACAADHTCEAGYSCSANNTCVIPLTGAIGLGINGDGTTWWGSGKCDESCQRWVSACVLARTNAYGVHVNISMRAPADAPQAIKDALAVSDVERNGDSEHAAYSLREGAYYGNIFATTPGTLDASGHFVPSTDGATAGVIEETPAFYACAGPGSNIPEVTKRFCSSQGDQVVINVPGVCLGTSSEPGTCARADGDPTSATYGAMQDCYTTAGTTTDSTGNVVHNGLPFKEVITVFLQQPISVCGNAVCEGSESDPRSPGYCASDCHPGTWAKDIPADLTADSAHFPGWGGYYPGSMNGAYNSLSSIGPDNTIVVAGSTSNDVPLGDVTLPASQGRGILVKYNADGSYAWAAPGVRFGGGALEDVAAVAVGPNGNITVAWDSSYPYHFSITTFDSQGALLGTWTPDTSVNIKLFKMALDSQGNVLLGGQYVNSATFGPTSTSGSMSLTSDFNTFVAKVSPQATVLWATNVPAAATYTGPWALVVDSHLVGGVPADDVLLGRPIVKLSSSDGSVLWTDPLLGSCADPSTCAPPNVTALGVDANGDVYASGTFGLAPTLADVTKYDGRTGRKLWTVFDANSQINASFLTFDPSGNVILASYGPSVDFGVGTFPTYRFPNLFLSAYSPDVGKLLWAKHVPMVLSSTVGGLTVDGRGHVVISGTYSGSMQADDRLLVTGVPEQPDVVDSFVASFSEPSPLDTTPPAIGAAVDQTGAPILTVPANIFAQATGSAGAVVFFMPPTAIDTGNTGTSVYCTPPPNSMFPIGATPVKCTASDPLGNRSSATFTVTVADTLPPLFSPLADMTVQASGAGGAAVTYSPVAIDQVDNSPSLACTPASGSTFPVGKTTVTCTATDAHNNQSQATFSVTVLAPTDTSPPTIVTPASMTVPMTSSGGAIVNYDASATDDTAVASFSCTPPSGTVLPLGTTTVSCNAKDTAGNTSSASFTVTVADVTPPSPTVPSNITAEAAGPNGAVVTFAASATDVVDGNVPVTCSPASGSVFALGSTHVACSASDTHGNSANASFTVTVVDTTPPSPSLPGAITVTGTSANGAIVSYTASASDLVDGAVSPVCTPASGSTFAFGSSTVNCTATDAHGNRATGSFAVNVQYSWSGILQPIDPDGNSLFKLGSTVSVKFQLTGASAGITNAVATLTVMKTTSSVVGTDVEAVSTAAASTGNAFRYDATSGQYVFNLDTKGLSRGTWLLSIDLHDGVTRRMTISLR